MPRNKKIKAARLWLSARYPNAFMPQGKPKRPLKIGIREEVHAAAKSAEGRPALRYIRRAINDYCQGPSYLVACQAGAVRIGLDGRAAGRVRPADEQFAFTLLRGHVGQMQKVETKTKTFEVTLGVLMAAVAAHDARAAKMAA